MDEREKLLRKIVGQNEDDFAEVPEEPINTDPLFLLREIWPNVVDRLKNLLTDEGELKLAATVDGLQVYDRCRCGADYCSIVHTSPGRAADGGQRIALLPSGARTTLSLLPGCELEIRADPPQHNT